MPAGAAADTVSPMAIDVTDATFQTEVINRSAEVPVIIDLWAPWCGPCRTLGPIIEKAVDDTDGKAVLVKVNVDENPGISRAFQVQSIPAVYAMRDGQIVDGFMGAQPEHIVTEWVQSLLPTPEQSLVASLIEAGGEDNLRRAVELEPGNEDAIVALAALLVEEGHVDEHGQFDEALALLERIPESERTRPIAAAARLGNGPSDGYDHQLTELLTKVKADDDARQQFVDILEVMGPDDPRTADYRKKLSRVLF